MLPWKCLRRASSKSRQRRKNDARGLCGDPPVRQDSPAPEKLLEPPKLEVERLHVLEGRSGTARHHAAPNASASTATSPRRSSSTRWKAATPGTCSNRTKTASPEFTIAANGIAASSSAWTGASSSRSSTRRSAATARCRPSNPTVRLRLSKPVSRAASSVSLSPNSSSS